MRRVVQGLASTGLLSRSGANALVAQLLTLAALVVPVAFRLTAELPTVVLAAAIASILSYPATLGAIVRVPPMGCGRAGRAVLRRSVVALLVATGLVGALAAIAAGPDGVVAGVALQVAVVLLAQGLFFIAQARSIAALDFASVARVRLVYGALGLALTFALHVGPDGVGPLARLRSRHDRRRAARPRLPPGAAGPGGLGAAMPPESVARTLRAGLVVGSSLGFGNLATQAPALVLPVLGPLAPAWSLVTRLGNGFLTVGGNIVGPTVAIRFSSALQLGDGAALRTALRLASA